MQNKVLVHLGQQGWLATFVGPHAERIIRLFDTATLLLPLTASAPLEMVLASVRANQPAGVTVEHFQ